MVMVQNFMFMRMYFLYKICIFLCLTKFFWLMDKLQKARLDLFNMMHGRIIPNSVMADIRYDAGDDLFDKFKKIYEDPKQKYLLIANDTTLSGYQAF